MNSINKDVLTFLNTNARSLCPKFESMLDNFKELDCCFGVVTETWLKDGKLLEDQLRDVQDGHGLSVIYKNRKPNTRGVAHGKASKAARYLAMPSTSTTC